jgi:hypothetical protein
MSFSTVVFIAAAATVAKADYTNTWWTPSSLLPSSTPVQSVWTPSSVAADPVWTPSSESVWTPSTSAESVWAPSSTWVKGNVSVSTSYTNTVYVTKATTATTTVDCGKGTMIYGNGSSPVHTPKVGLPSGMPTDLPSEWSKSIPASVLPPQLTSGGIMTTNCANASITYTITYTPSSSKPKQTSSSIEAPSEPTDPSFPTLPPSGEDGAEFPAPGPHSDDDDDDGESSDDSSSGSSKPSSGFSNGDDMDMDSAASRQDISAAGTVLALGIVAVAAFML